MLNFLFNIIINPIITLITLIFGFFSQYEVNPGLTIIIMSLILNLIYLPLYLKADKLQEEEKEKRKKLNPKIKSIKANFKGEERFFMLSTYYRQNNYRPFMALRNSLSLLLQIPFFIGAYYFFSHLELLVGTPFLFINDLSKPDNLITLKGFSVNILPFLMTLVNIISSEIYCYKNSTPKERIQLYSLAAIFLVLLYNAPSSLVLYWTFNNVFSCFKNIFSKYKISYSYLYIISIALIGSVFTSAKKLFYTDIQKITIYSFLLTILILTFKKRMNLSFLEKFNKDMGLKSTFYLSCILLWAIFGFMIPFGVVSNSPSEFTILYSPLKLLITPIAQSFGIFIVWPILIYFMFKDKIKNIISFFLCSYSILCVLNMVFFSFQGGTLAPTLNFYEATCYTKWPIWNIFLNISLFLLIGLTFFKNKIKLINRVLIILIIAALTSSIYFTFKIQNYAEKQKAAHVENRGKLYSLSREKKNVIIIMLDRAISSYLPIILKENPSLSKKFDGFVFYPNTLSFYPQTILAYPALIGGYEYTPKQLEARKDKKMVEKNDEALLMLPTLFKNNGYEVTLSDSPYTNYGGKLSEVMFKGQGINFYRVIGKYNNFSDKNMLEDKKLNKFSKKIERNFLFFNFLVTSPIPLRDYFYNSGAYFNDPNQAGDIDYKYYLDNYYALKQLPALIDYNSNKGTLNIINNELTHATTGAAIPKKEPLNAFRRRKSFSLMHYGINYNAIELVGNLLDELKKNNAYDNTRIIIVSDHGFFGLSNKNLSKFAEDNTMLINSLLVVKDFNKNGPYKTDKTFMTTADVPFLATKNLIKSPKNPYTNKEITDDWKKGGIDTVIKHCKYDVKDFQTYRAIQKEAEFWHVKDDIFDERNWEYKGIYKE